VFSPRSFAPPQCASKRPRQRLKNQSLRELERRQRWAHALCCTASPNCERNGRIAESSRTNPSTIEAMAKGPSMDRCSRKRAVALPLSQSRAGEDEKNMSSDVVRTPYNGGRRRFSIVAFPAESANDEKGESHIDQAVQHFGSELSLKRSNQRGLTYRSSLLKPASKWLLSRIRTRASQATT
jgi:hypothetical protein